MENRDTFFYDADCGLCQRLMGWAARLDRRHRFRFVSLYSPEADRTFAHLAWEQRLASSHLVEPGGRIFSGAQGILEGLARLVTPLLPLIRLYQLLPGSAWLAERAYRWVADHRRTLGCRIDKPH